MTAAPEPLLFDAVPRARLLGNGRYTVMLTTAGSGYSRWRDVAITRWREDATCDAWGSYVFLRDRTDGRVWGVTHQPLGASCVTRTVAGGEGGLDFTATDDSISASIEIVVAADEDAEVRRVSLRNTGDRVRVVEATTYLELVLSPADADAAHPAFSKMFVQTEFVAAGGVLLATRRHREPNDTTLWAAHVSVVEGEDAATVEYETDRARFLGRGGDLRTARALRDGRPLSNSSGTVLDPVFALRRTVRIAPGGTARIDFWTLVAPTREAALAAARARGAAPDFEAVKARAVAYSQARRRERSIEAETAESFQRLAGHVLYAHAALRAPADLLHANVQGPAALWAHGVSGDLPLVVARIAETATPLLDQLLEAHAYLSELWLSLDLVFILSDRAAESTSVQAAIQTATAARERARSGQGESRGRIVALHASALTPGGVDAFTVAARAFFCSKRGTLTEQLDRARSPAPHTPDAPREHSALDAAADAGPADAAAQLEFFNGLGGFAQDGREYVTRLDAGRHTPAPWVNVITNEHFGFQISTDGTGSTWTQNSRENQLTPWSNDPVSDPPSEVIYVRDERSGEFWSATPLPVRQAEGRYTVRHGFGYSRCEHVSHGISLDLLQFVALHEPVKIARLRLSNLGAESRRLTLTHYVEWVLGNQRSKTAPFIVTEIDASSGALLARNPWRQEYKDRVAFLDMRGAQRSGTGDRQQFLGRHGSLEQPAALLIREAALVQRVGGGLDPCGALRTALTLAPGESAEVCFLLGEGQDRGAALALVERYRSIDLEAVQGAPAEYWRKTLRAVQVRTPDRSLDILMNGWLLYQTLACRLWARSGFYQASGAYGFRDQLQDVMALCVARPELARAHLLRAAARQFEAGDVQHWWLPTSGQGVKTRISDNRIWLAYVTAHYLEVTADRSILDQPVPFLAGPPLRADQAEIFEAPAISERSATLFEHCRLALDSSLATGAHGLPLFGAGDWNDGMNRVGIAGRGESVWLGWFLKATLSRFAVIAAERGNFDRATAWTAHASSLQQAIERESWDGGWYRRGYYDDGTPLGSATSDECRIDSIAQSWAVLSSDAADRDADRNASRYASRNASRIAQALSALDAQLVDRANGLLKLFAPPFADSAHDPGYIKAYPAGLRENGGQYTHAATWTVLAFAQMGDGDRAGELLALLNPINHASAEGLQRYKVEPYVICADVYTAAGHVGRGGWTWYTGSAGWLYRTAVEGLLGLKLRGAQLLLEPCIPRAWSGFVIEYRHGATQYHIEVKNPRGVCRGVSSATLDGNAASTTPCLIDLTDDAVDHRIEITLG
jgi:cyclic beta-1,2-glucan synthetase